MKNTKSIKNLKILLTDVDCVLTDGGMYYTSDGDIMKKFHTRDGMGVNLLKRNGIPTIIVTKEKTPIVKKWAEKMNIEHVYDNVQKKEDILKIITKKYGVKNSEIGYIGDDVNDIELLKKVGFSATPQDGISEVRSIVDHICEKKGGEGAFREIADIFLRYIS
jgi:YrbI family 3-deoxy-D-manno-octulosonate 8-phosphate phosphatase|tara:strand:+ start:292 stop:780 length:489 start_codon:yes stop_codon:yes gene_type:complete